MRALALLLLAAVLAGCGVKADPEPVPLDDAAQEEAATEEQG